MPLSRHRESIISHAPGRLRAEIIAVSIADSWDEARGEWALADVYLTDSPGRCLCGHPITEHCLIVNHLNGNEVVVGNVCVQQFIGLPSERLFAALRRISADIGAALNDETIEHAYREGWINNWEASFYLDTMRKRKLWPRQRAKRVEINEKVLARCRGGAVCNA